MRTGKQGLGNEGLGITENGKQKGTEGPGDNGLHIEYK